VTVPAEYSIDIRADRPTRSERLYAFPAIPFVEAAVAAVPIGIARAALDAFTDLARTRRAYRSRRLLRADPTTQGEIGGAELHVRSADALLSAAVGDMWRAVKAGRRPTLEQRAQLRVGCVNAGESAAAAVDIVYRLGGAASIFEGNRIERCFRDVHTATQHGARGRWPQGSWIWSGRCVWAWTRRACSDHPAPTLTPTPARPMVRAQGGHAQC
jgi:hypothetical protein